MAGQMMGAVLEFARAPRGAAHALRALATASLTSDGMIDNSAGGRGKGIWKGDSSDTAAHLRAGATARPAAPRAHARDREPDRLLPAERLGRDRGDRRSRTTSALLAEAVVLNYLALHNRVGDFASGAADERPRLGRLLRQPDRLRADRLSAELAALRARGGILRRMRALATLALVLVRADARARARALVLNFRDAELSAVVAAVARATGQRFVHDTELRGRVTIMLEDEVSPDGGARGPERRAAHDRLRDDPRPARAAGRSCRSRPRRAPRPGCTADVERLRAARDHAGAARGRRSRPSSRAARPADAREHRAAVRARRTV